MYITYKIINTITGEYYIGSHKTDNPNDNYLGSGRLIRESVKQYGVENHTKEILGVFQTREDSIKLEHKLIKEKKSTKKEIISTLKMRGKFCSKECYKKVRESGLVKIKQGEKRKLLLQNKDIIIERHNNNETYRTIAKDYNVSANTIKELLKGRLD